MYSRFARLIFSHIIALILISDVVIISSTRVTRDKLHINRYFLQIDNIFDYKTQDILINSPNQRFYNQVDQDWVTQPLDHFNPLEEHTFWQVCDNLFKILKL